MVSGTRDTVVLVRGYVESLGGGRHRAAGTVTLVTGDPLMMVDTGAPEQRQAILDALAAHGVDPAAIEYVVNTHGHLDHVGNNNLFPQATFVLDTDVGRAGEYWTHDFSRTNLEIGATDGVSPIVVMPTAGHTDHDLSVLVRTSIGTVAIVGDLFEYATDREDNAWRAWSKDAGLQERSRELVLASADYIIPGHGEMFRTSRQTGVAGSR